jgi:hypothetical protein
MKPSLLQKCQRDEIEIKVGLTVDTLADVHGLMGSWVPTAVHKKSF